MTDTETPVEPPKKNLPKLDPARCPERSKSGRLQCKTPLADVTPEHEHVFTNRTAERPSLPSGFALGAAEEVKAEQVLVKTGNRKDTKPRDANQKRVDADAAKSFKANVAAGSKPDAEFKTLKVSRYLLPPEAFDATKAMLDRACGSGGPVPGAILRYRKGTHPSGKIELQWAFVKPAA